MACYSIKVAGRVQGVWFRASTREEAERLGVSGFVSNEPDGSVYIEACGERDTIKELIQWCHEGPPLARVTSVEAEEIDANHEGTFQIRRGR